VDRGANAFRDCREELLGVVEVRLVQRADECCELGGKGGKDLRGPLSPGSGLRLEVGEGDGLYLGIDTVPALVDALDAIAERRVGREEVEMAPARERHAHLSELPVGEEEVTRLLRVRAHDEGTRVEAPDLLERPATPWAFLVN
jgi:hypothetical protein